MADFQVAFRHWRLTSFREPQQNPPRQSDTVSDSAASLISKISSSSAPLADAWDSALSSRRYSSKILAEAFIRLDRAKEHDSVVEGIQSAIRNDHAQPWMYDVLSLQMQLAGRPQKQIDRVLLSRVDFAAGNEPQLLVTASLMSRLGAHERALELCREAAKLNPWQPTTWGVARRIADRTKSAESITWSRVGTMKHVWTDGHEALHKSAETELRDLEKSLLQSGDPSSASKVRMGIQDGRTHDLRISVEWAGTADLDLSVVEPNGKTCSYKHNLTQNGGMLIRQSSGGAAKVNNGRHLEEYVCVEAIPGQYRVRIRLITGRLIGGRAIVRVIRHENTPREQKQSLTVVVGTRDAEIAVPLTSGRAARKSK